MECNCNLERVLLSEDLTPEHADTEHQSDSKAGEVVDANKVVAYLDRN